MIIDYLKESLMKEEKVQKISLQQAKDNKMFGPLYHGTTETNRKNIEDQGFKIFIGKERDGNISHGYQDGNYANGIPAPVHHLGYGIYFSINKSIAKDYAYGTVKGLKEYYLDINPERFLTINFGSQNTMMKWWIQNGYDPEIAKVDRVEATKKFTEQISSKYDAVWFKGKGLRRLLDGDQVCVYDTSIIKELDKSMTVKGEVGSKVIAKVDINKINGRPEYGIIPKGTKGIFLGRREIEEPYSSQYHNGEKEFLNIKWQKGGTYNNVYGSQVEFI